MNPAFFIFGAFVLVASWPDGTETRIPATTLKDCMVASEAYVTKGLAPPGPVAKSARCEPAANPTDAGFEPNWDCIKGFNCKER